MNKSIVHITANRKSKELSVDLEQILHSESWPKYTLKYDLLLIKATSKDKIQNISSK